jgi:hypothetical protein
MPRSLVGETVKILKGNKYIGQFGIIISSGHGFYQVSLVSSPSTVVSKRGEEISIGSEFEEAIVITDDIKEAAAILVGEKLRRMSE